MFKLFLLLFSILDRLLCGFDLSIRKKGRMHDKKCLKSNRNMVHLLTFCSKNTVSEVSSRCRKKSRSASVRATSDELSIASAELEIMFSLENHLVGHDLSMGMRQAATVVLHDITPLPAPSTAECRLEREKTDLACSGSIDSWLLTNVWV